MLFDEALTFQQDGVKLGAMAGKHDDDIIATAIALQMYHRVKPQISHEGGIIANAIKTAGQREFE